MSEQSFVRVAYMIMNISRSRVSQSVYYSSRIRLTSRTAGVREGEIGKDQRGSIDARRG
jgi:hypothetical protein